MMQTRPQSPDHHPRAYIRYYYYCTTAGGQTTSKGVARYKNAAADAAAAVEYIWGSIPTKKKGYSIQGVNVTAAAITISVVYVHYRATYTKNTPDFL